VHTSVVLEIFMLLSSFLAKLKMYSLNINSPVLFPCPGSPHSTFCNYEFDFPKYPTEAESYSVCLFMTGT
jgi:hypothetical protein